MTELMILTMTKLGETSIVKQIRPDGHVWYIVIASGVDIFKNQCYATARDLFERVGGV